MSGGLEYLTGLAQKLLEKSLAERCRVFASIMVPGAAMGCCLTFLLVNGPSFQSERSLALSPLRTAIRLGDAGATVEIRDGMALFATRTDREWFLPMEDGGSGELWTSLDEELMKANADRIQLSKDGIRLRLPLIGTNAPLVAVATTRSSGRVLSSGRSDLVSLYEIKPVLPEALPLWSTLSLMLGFGASVVTATTRTE